MKNIIETICVKVTSKCNLACTHCRANSELKNKPFIDLSFLKTFLLEAKTIGLKHVSLSGGEPGLDDRIGEFTKWLLKNQFYVTITTNGLSPLIAVLRSSQLVPNRFLRIYVSIDGGKDLNDQIRGEGCFEKTIKKVYEIKRWAAWVGLNTVIFPEICDSIDDLISLATKIGVNRWALITPVYQGSYSSRQVKIQDTLKFIKKIQAHIENSNFVGDTVIYNFVGTPHTSMIINTNGDILLQGIYEGDDVFVDNLENFQINRIKKVITKQNSRMNKTYFTWNKWDSEKLQSADIIWDNSHCKILGSKSDQVHS